MKAAKSDAAVSSTEGSPTLVSRAWDAYQAHSDKVIPLLAPLATVIGTLATLAVGVFLARAALRQARTATELAKIAARQADIASDRHEEQTKADLRRRITESFTKATEQLGNEKIETRLGGIYTLERVSRESPNDYWTVMETLCAFVRERAQWKQPHTLASETVPKFYADAKKEPLRLEPSTDVAAVLSVIKRRFKAGQEREKTERLKLDLRATDLRGANLREANLREADLSGANLSEANLREADLSGANLSEANLSEAGLFKADLSGAYLTGTNLSGAYLKEANLREANLREANLSGAYLKEANLREANLREADLSEANLREANLREANLREADLSGANLREADLSDVVGLTEEQLAETHGDEKTRLSDGMTRPAHWPPEEPKAKGAG